MNRIILPKRCQGPFAGARQYIHILQLLAEHPVKRIQQAIELCMAHSTTNGQAIINKIHRLAHCHIFEFNVESYRFKQSIRKE